MKKTVLTTSLAIATQFYSGDIKATAPIPFDTLPGDNVCDVLRVSGASINFANILSTNKKLYELGANLLSTAILRDISKLEQNFLSHDLSAQDVELYKRHSCLDTIKKTVTELKIFVVNKNAVAKNVLMHNASDLDLTWASLTEYLDDHQDFYQGIYNTIFKNDEDDASSRTPENESILQHLTSSYFVFATKESGFTKLNTEQKNHIITELPSLYNSRTYIPIAEFQEGVDYSENTFFTMRDDIVEEINIHPDPLLELLTHTPNAKIILDVGKFVDENGVLKSPEYIRNAAHLILTNSLGNVTTIGNDFLFYPRKLQFFEVSGFTNLETIGDNFLYFANLLQSCDVGGFTNVKNIGNRLLSNARSLQIFDAAYFRNIEMIENYFLHETNLDGEKIKEEILSRN